MALRGVFRQNMCFGVRSRSRVVSGDLCVVGDEGGLETKFGPILPFGEYCAIRLSVGQSRGEKDQLSTGGRTKGIRTM